MDALEGEPTPIKMLWQMTPTGERVPMKRSPRPIIAIQGIKMEDWAILPGNSGLSFESLMKGELVYGEVSDSDRRMSHLGPEYLEKLGYKTELMRQFAYFPTGGIWNKAGLSGLEIMRLAVIADRMLLLHLGKFGLPLSNLSGAYATEYQDRRSTDEISTYMDKLINAAPKGKVTRIADFGSSKGEGLVKRLLTIQGQHYSRRYEPWVELLRIDKVLQGREIVDITAEKTESIQGQSLLDIQGDLALPEEIDAELVANGHAALTGSCDLVTIFDVLHVAAFPHEIFKNAWRSTVKNGKILLGKSFDNIVLYQLRDDVPEENLRELENLTAEFGDYMSYLHSTAGLEYYGSVYGEMLKDMLADDSVSMSRAVHSFRNESITRQEVQKLIDTKNHYQLGLLFQNYLLAKLEKAAEGCYHQVKLVDYLRKQGIKVTPIPILQSWYEYIDRCIETDEEAAANGVTLTMPQTSIPQNLLDKWYQTYIEEDITLDEIAYYEVTKSAGDPDNPMAEVYIGGIRAYDFHADSSRLPTARPCIK